MGFKTRRPSFHKCDAACGEYPLAVPGFRAHDRRVWRSALVAALFAVHPLHVESVAWVSERKDVLSTFFGLLAVWAYFKYARDSSVRYYLLMLCLFGLGLMAKPMLVSLPCILLLLDIWPLQRWKLWRIDDQVTVPFEPKATTAFCWKKYHCWSYPRSSASSRLPRKTTRGPSLVVSCFRSQVAWPTPLLDTTYTWTSYSCR